MVLCGTAVGPSTPIGDRGTTRGAVYLIAGAGEHIDALLAAEMAFVGAPVESQLRLPEPAVEPFAISVAKAATPDSDPRETAVPAAEAPVSEAPLGASAPTPPLETQVQ